MQQGAAQLGKTHVAPAGNHMVSQRHYSLLVHLMAHLRAAQHHFEGGALGFEQAHHLTGGCDVPNKHTPTHHLHRAIDRIAQRGQQLINDVLRFARNGEFAQRGARAQVTHVGQQVAQPQ